MLKTSRLRQSLCLSTRRMSSTYPLVSNTHRPANWKAAAPDAGARTTTFGAQSSLPRLPVPELKDTVARLKESLRPLARDAGELTEAERKIDALAAGLGTELQQRLLARRDATQHWLEDWWDDGAYLGYRDSVVVNVSYYYGFNASPAHLSNTPVARAAGISRSAMLFRQKFRRGEVKPEGTREGPHCMDTWRWMFDCCRVPGQKGLDWSVTHAKTGDTGETGHIVVIRRGRFYKIDMFIEGRLLSTAELEKQFEQIYQNTTQDYPGVGVLTSANRDLWAKDYAELASDPHNADILNEIHSSAFVLCLDTEKPSGPVAFSRGLWHGAQDAGAGLGLRNRWVDKPVQFIVFDNGQAGIMGEHSIMDGTPTARMCDDVLDALYSPTFDHGSSAGASTPPAPVALDWRVSKATQDAIARAEGEARELIGSQELGFYRSPYGKAAIKAFGVSPDSWAQMIIQLAYARLLRATGKQREGGTYEAATTRKFLKGRTEAIRVVSAESDAWVAAMDDAGHGRAERKALFDKATKKHIERAKEAGNGQGVDRHLLGLRMLVKEGEEVPALYSDPLFLRSKNWVLSTSAIYCKHFEVYGWGEVVPEGFGVPYAAGHDDYLQYTVTSRKEMPNAQFIDELKRAAEDVYKLHAEQPKAKL